MLKPSSEVTIRSFPSFSVIATVVQVPSWAGVSVAG